MIKLKNLINEVVDGQNYFNEKKFASIVLSEFKKEFPRFFNIKLLKSINLQTSKHKAYYRSNIYNSELLVVFNIEYNSNEYQVRILNIFKKVPDDQLTNKFTMVDDNYLRKMPYKSLEPKDLNSLNPLLLFRCRVVKNDETVLIPKKQEYATLFDDYKTLKQTVDDIVKIINNDSGFGGEFIKNSPLPTTPNMQPVLKEANNKIEVPDEPETVPIPSNHLRLYHYTYTNPEILKREGLKLSHAKGHTYGEPNAVWASLKMPNNHKTFVEFSMAIDDQRFNKWAGSAPDITAGVEFYKDRGTDFTITGDIKPSEFIAIHEPWHNTYRYLVKNNLVSNVLSGEYDDINEKNHPTEYKALQVIKNNFSK